MKKRRNLIVTLADSNYIDKARQLFSSIYHNSGWEGNYMLLVHEVPEKKLGWFRDKGIIIIKCPPIAKRKPWKNYFPTSVLSKFYLFTPYFKNWDRVIFLDVDIIVRSSLDKLTNVEGFSAGENIGFRLNDEFPELDKKFFDFEGESFCTGVMAFSTDIIKEDDFEKLLDLYERYGKYSVCGEQGIINLFFYDKDWKQLPRVYNVAPNYLEGKMPQKRDVNLDSEMIDGAIIHFLYYPKPWDKESGHHGEWNENLKLSEKIDLNNRKKSVRKVRIYHHLNHYYHLNKHKPKIYFERHYERFGKYYRITINEIKKFLNWLVFSIDRSIGLFGLRIKKRNPALYSFLKKN